MPDILITHDVANFLYVKLITNTGDNMPQSGPICFFEFRSQM